jgi:hypothetical protein
LGWPRLKWQAEALAPPQAFVLTHRALLHAKAG